MAYFEKYIFAPEKNEGNYLLHAGATHFEGDLSAESYTLKMPITGAEYYQINGRRLKVKNDQFILTNPDDEVMGQVQSQKMVEGLYVGLSKEFVRNVTANMSGQSEKWLEDISSTCPIRFVDDSYRLTYSPSGSLMSTYLLAYREGRLTPLVREQFFMDLAESLIQEQTNIKTDLSALHQVKISTRKELLKRVYLMDEYIRDCFLQDISLDTLSQIAGLSKYHSLRCYQAVFNTSPYQRILSLRLEKGKDLLEKGMPITVVAQFTNFTDRRAFTKSFRKRFGITPSQFAGKK